MICAGATGPLEVPMRVADLMTTDVAMCSPRDSIRAAAQRMNDRRCGCLPVLAHEGDGRLVGIVTDRDITCRAVAQGLDPERTEVARCMSFPVHTVARDADLGECAERFTAMGVRRLVVVNDDNRCLGIISRADLQRWVIEQAEPVPQSGNGPPAERFPATTATRSDPELTL
jgi:CBS domain-containing protein